MFYHTKAVKFVVLFFPANSPFLHLIYAEKSLINLIHYTLHVHTNA